MYQLILALAFQMDPGVQAYREMIIRHQMREMQEKTRTYKIRKQQQEAQEAAIRDYFFAQKFNKLLDKLREFTNNYNAGRVNAKTVAELKKAWRSLEKDEGWFHEPKQGKAEGDEQKSPRDSDRHKIEACGT